MVCRTEIMGLVSIYQKRLIVNLNNKIFRNCKAYMLVTVSHLVLCKPLTMSYKPYWKFLCKLLTVVGWIKYLVPIKFFSYKHDGMSLLSTPYKLLDFKYIHFHCFKNKDWMSCFLWNYKLQRKCCSLHGKFTIMNLSLEILMMSLQTTFYYQTFHINIWYFFTL